MANLNGDDYALAMCIKSHMDRSETNRFSYYPSYFINLICESSRFTERDLLFLRPPVIDSIGVDIEWRRAMREAFEL